VLGKIAGQQWAGIDQRFLKGLTPEDIFHYIYAIFHAAGFRDRFADVFKRDLPRVPITADLKLFRELAAKGRELIALHLLNEKESPRIDQFITRYPIPGTNVVEKVECDSATRCVKINDKQYFEGVPTDAYEFRVGGYQVCEKWLKDRKGRTLSYGDLQHWQLVVVALAETQRLMEEIDELIPAWPLR
jgi:predicted helicase